MARNKYPEETIHRILEVSLRLFLEKGYENTSIQDIIDNLGGLTKGAIYHHFKSKEDILEAVLDQILLRSEEDWIRLINDTQMTGLEKLQAIFRMDLESPKQRNVFRVAPDMLKNPKMLTLQIRSIFEESAPCYVRPLIEQGIADGSIRTEYPQQLAEVYLLLINLWLTPLVYLADMETMHKRFRFFQELTRSLGVELLTDDLLPWFEEYCRLCRENRSDEEKA